MRALRSPRHRVLAEVVGRTCHPQPSVWTIDSWGGGTDKEHYDLAALWVSPCPMRCAAMSRHEAGYHLLLPHCLFTLTTRKGNAATTSCRTSTRCRSECTLGRYAPGHASKGTGRPWPRSSSRTAKTTEQVAPMRRQTFAHRAGGAGAHSKLYKRGTLVWRKITRPGLSHSQEICRRDDDTSQCIALAFAKNAGSPVNTHRRSRCHRMRQRPVLYRSLPQHKRK